jgi:hypothetical protein
MKKISIFLITLLLFVYASAQTIGSNVSLIAVDGKTYTGNIIDVDNGKYKVKYDGFDFSSWLNKDQFSLVNNNPPLPQNNNITITNNQPIRQNKNNGAVGKLYSGSGFNGNVYYYFMPSGQVVLGCPRGGLENFNVNTFCTSSPNSCGTYLKTASTLNIKWKNGGTRTGKIKANGDIDIDASLIGEMRKVSVKLSAAYDFGIIMTGVSVAETTKFNLDGTYSVIKVGGVEHGNNGAEWNTNSKGKYKINGYTITMTENDGRTTFHTIYTMEKGVANPDFLGWDGNFLSKTK